MFSLLLCSRFLTHCRRRGLHPDKAKDLTQDFFYSVLYEKDLFGTARRSKGKFRSFLLTALDRYLIDRNRYEKAEKRSMDRAVTNAELLDNLEIPDCYHAMNDQDSFDYAWAASLILVLLVLVTSIIARFVTRKRG